MGTWTENILYDPTRHAIAVSQASGYQFSIAAADIPVPAKGRDSHGLVLSFTGSTGAGLTDTTFGDVSRIEIKSGSTHLINMTYAQYRAWWKERHPLRYDLGSAPYNLPIPFGDFWESDIRRVCEGAAPRDQGLSVILTFAQTQNGTGQKMLGHVELNDFGVANHTNFLLAKQLLATAAANAAPYDSGWQERTYDERGTIISVAIPYDGIKEVELYQKGSKQPVLSLRNRYLNEYAAANTTNKSINSGSPMLAHKLFTESPTADVDAPDSTVRTGIHIEKFDAAPIILPQGSYFKLRTDEGWDGASTEVFAHAQLEWPAAA